MRVLKDLIFEYDSSDGGDEMSVKQEPVSPEESSQELLACRVCLSTDVKLYKLNDCKLGDTFEEFTGTPVLPEDGLPQHLCCTCGTLLRKAVDFRDRCRRVHSHLMDIAMWRPQLTTEDLRCVNINSKLPFVTTQILATDFFPVIQDTPDNTGKPPKDIYKYTEARTKDISKDTEKHDIVENVKMEVVDVKEEILDDQHINPGITDEAKKGSIVTLNKDNINIDNGNENEDVSVNNSIIKDVTDVTVHTESGKQERNVSDTDSEVCSDNCTDDIEMDVSNVNKLGNQMIDFYDKALSNETAKFSKTYNLDIEYLTKENQLQEMEEKRNSKGFKNSKYKCEICCRVFATKRTSIYHSKYHDASFGEFECEICRRRYSNKYRWKDHTRQHHTVRFSCRTCGQVFPYAKYAVEHYELHCQKNSIKCKDCSQTFGSEVQLFVHMSKQHVQGTPVTGDILLQHEKFQTHVCPRCYVGFWNTDALHKHQCDKSSCVTCGHGFDTKIALMRHRKQAHKTSKNCEQCAFTCNTERAMDRHWRTEHKGLRRIRHKSEKITCPICLQVMALGLLERHIAKKCFRVLHQCKFCDKRFQNPLHLQDHDKTHEVEPPVPVRPLSSVKTYGKKMKHMNTLVFKIHFEKSITRHTKLVHEDWLNENSSPSPPTSCWFQMQYPEKSQQETQGQLFLISCLTSN